MPKRILFLSLLLLLLCLSAGLALFFIGPLSQNKAGPPESKPRVELVTGKTRPFDLARLRALTQDLELTLNSEGYTLVNFWASWCYPCWEELYVLDEIKNAVEIKELKILPVGLFMDHENLELGKKLWAENDIDFKFLAEKESFYTEEYNIPALPFAILLDRQGQVRIFIHGALPLTAEDLISFLKDQLQKIAALD